MKFVNSNYLEPNNFVLQSKTIWSFPERGTWATHSGDYKGNWSPFVPRNLILRYSSKGDVVLDQFLGSGTTLIECRLLERQGIGIDINPKALKISKENIKFDYCNKYYQQIVQGDARNLDKIKDKSIDFICTHPPYSNIIKYSENIIGDMSLLDINDFLIQMKLVVKECYRVLKPNKYCAILIGDIRRKKQIIPLGFKVMQLFLNTGFVLKEIIIKEQHNCSSTSFWTTRNKILDFLLISHEYLFVFNKPY